MVLRSVSRFPGGDDYERDCTSGECLYVWRGLVEVASELESDSTVHVLYHLTSDPTWWEVEATPEEGGAPGFRRYALTLSEHLFGPDDVADEERAIELVAFLRRPDGSRLFDHNLHSGDFDNHELTRSNGFGASDDETCQPEVAELMFHGNWEETTYGVRRQGGYLEVSYDVSRLPRCRGADWEIEVFVRSLPSGEVLSGPVDDRGEPMARRVLSIPDDATGLEVWFENSDATGCREWDSNWGSNYAYDVWPAADDPRCLDIEKDRGTHGEDPRMVHNEPHCLAYELEDQADAGGCEFFVDGFGDGHMGHYGIPYHWLVGYLRVGHREGEVLNAGMYSRYFDNGAATPSERFSLGLEVAPGVWKVGLAYFTASIMGSEGRDYEVEEVAFFIDLRRPTGEVVRLWQSRSGQNYRLDEVFGLPTTGEYIPYGNIQWANDASPVFESRRRCR